MEKPRNFGSTSKVVSINDLRIAKAGSQEGKSYKEHLELLSFSELINETSTLIKEVNASNLDGDLELKSKLTVKELGSRLRKQGLSKKESQRLNDLDC